MCAVTQQRVRPAPAGKHCNDFGDPMTVAVCTTANSCAKEATSDCQIRLVVLKDVRMVAATNINFVFPATCAHA